MAKMTKENAMLIDVQYIKPRRGKQDLLYVIWKDLDTDEKHLEIIPEPKMEIYFEKPEFRTHEYNITHQKVENCYKKVVSYKNIIYEIANEMGESGRNFLNQCQTTGNYKDMKKIFLYPYSFGADLDIRTYYRYKWLQTMDNDRVKRMSCMYGDIETDISQYSGFPDPTECPIDLVTIIDDATNISYTFCLTGVPYKEKDLSLMTDAEIRQEEFIKEGIKHRTEEQEYYKNNQDILQEEIHKMFDENYPGMEYKVYFYTDEKKMLVHLFQLINLLKRDLLMFWNMPFDIPYLYDRIKYLGMDPKDVMCHPDFPEKECYFRKDTKTFEVKLKSDYFFCSSYTLYTCQMRNYAAIRKGRSELRSFSLNYVAKKELKDSKFDYHEEGELKTLSLVSWLKYFLYNIKDVLLQKGINNRTKDSNTYYRNTYDNMVPYESQFKQLKIQSGSRYSSFLKQGLIASNNFNAILNAKYSYKEDELDADDEEKDKNEGALVGDPTLIDNFGVYLYGRRTNNIFLYSFDMDMTSFYPSSNEATNNCQSTIIFKMIADATLFKNRGGKHPYHGITAVQLNKNNKDTFTGDIGKEIMDNFMTRAWLSFGYKWFNLPSVNAVYNHLLEVM